MWLLALWLGCPKPTPPVQLDADSDRGPRAPLREAIAGPDTWQGAGLCMAIRDGWAGTAGPAPQLLELNLDLIMPGYWEVTIDITCKGGGAAEVLFAFCAEG